MDNHAGDDRKNLSTAQTLMLVALLGLLFYWFVYRPENIRQVCRMAYPDTAPGGGPQLGRLPSLPFGEPDYTDCIKSYGLKN